MLAKYTVVSEDAVETHANVSLRNTELTVFGNQLLYMHVAFQCIIFMIFFLHLDYINLVLAPSHWLT